MTKGQKIDEINDNISKVRESFDIAFEYNRNDDNLPQIIDNYIKFSEEVDEYEWELENK